MRKTALGLFFLMLPSIIWAGVIGYLLGLKVVLILLLILPAVFLSVACKIIGRIILKS
jgi:hypothetical protein